MSASSLMHGRRRLGCGIVGKTWKLHCIFRLYENSASSPYHIQETRMTLPGKYLPPPPRLPPTMAPISSTTLQYDYTGIYKQRQHRGASLLCSITIHGVHNHSARLLEHCTQLEYCSPPPAHTDTTYKAYLAIWEYSNSPSSPPLKLVMD